jgi:mono/diheme cytochrome c family protein
MSHRSLLLVAGLVVPLGSALASATQAQDTITLRLPHGDAKAGKAVFEEMSCSSCHRVEGEHGFPDPVSSHPGPTLGGYTARQETERVAMSIFAPSHEITGTVRGEREDDLSPMPDFSEAMTVRQFLDLIAFIRSLGAGSP